MIQTNGVQMVVGSRDLEQEATRLLARNGLDRNGFPPGVTGVSVPMWLSPTGRDPYGKRTYKGGKRPKR